MGRERMNIVYSALVTPDPRNPPHVLYLLQWITNACLVKICFEDRLSRFSDQIYITGARQKHRFSYFSRTLLHCSLNGTVKKIRSSIQRKSKRNFIFILVWASLQFRVFKSDSLIRNIILYRGKGTRGILRKIRIDYLISHCKILRFIMMDRQVSRWSVRRNCSLSAGKTRW